MLVVQAGRLGVRVAVEVEAGVSTRADVDDVRTGLSLCDTVCDIAEITLRGPGTNTVITNKTIAIGSMNTSSCRVLTRCPGRRLGLTMSRSRMSPPVGCPGNCPATKSKLHHTTTAAVIRCDHGAVSV